MTDENHTTTDEPRESRSDGGTARLRAAVDAGMPAARDVLAALVALESVHDPGGPTEAACRRTAETVRDLFVDAGVADVDLVRTSDGSDAVVGLRPGPAGAPTVLLYCHYDVQPSGDPSTWSSAPFTLTERDGRWYGRGAADCKGNLVAHLLALRAWGDDLPVSVRIVAEGSEETGTGGLEDLVRERPELFDADLIVIGDAGNTAVGEPTVTTSLRGMTIVVVHVDTLAGPVHSGMFGGAAPDALGALVAMLASLRDPETGLPTVDGLDATGTWSGAGYPVDRFRADAGVLDGVDLAGRPRGGVDAAAIADAIWARPSVTVLGIDCPPVVGSAAAVPASASARIGLRVPPGTSARAAQDALVAHLERSAPHRARVRVEREAVGEPFRADTDGPALGALTAALEQVYGPPVRSVGQGGSIPLCTVLAQAHPDAEIALIGVEEPACRIHSADESVDPREIAAIATAEAVLFGTLADALGPRS